MVIRHWKLLIFFDFNVPKYSEISVEKLWNMVKECDDIMDYFPDLDQDKLPERRFLMGILSTLRTEEMKRLISEARANRSITTQHDEDELIEMSLAVKTEIFKALPQKVSAYCYNYILNRLPKDVPTFYWRKGPSLEERQLPKLTKPTWA